MNPLSLSRRIAALLLLVLPAPLGCEPPPLSLLAPGFAFPQLWPPPRQPLPPTSRKRIDLTAVPTLEPIQLVDGPPMKLETVSLGKPKVLLPRAKGTYYPAEHPLSDRRAMVRRIREDEHGRTMEQYEGYLVDFEDGVVERFDSISPYEQYSEAGIGFAWKSIDGVKHKVLVHADGQVVPMWPETDTAPDLLLHPIWRQAWIFGTQEFPTIDPSDDPEQTERRSVYIHWTDLRKPPPSGPKVALPFVLHFDERVINNETESVHGPRPKQQADVPFVVRGNLPGCSTIELDRDGGFHCRYGSYRTLAQGWSYTAFDDRNLDGYVELQNRETGEVQILHGENEGDDCEVTYSVMDPPRLLVVCDGWLDKLLVGSRNRRSLALMTTMEVTMHFAAMTGCSQPCEFRNGAPTSQAQALRSRWLDLEIPGWSSLPKAQRSAVRLPVPRELALHCEFPRLQTQHADKNRGNIQHRVRPVFDVLTDRLRRLDGDSILLVVLGTATKPEIASRIRS